MVDVRRLAVFVAVVEHRSLSAAARALGYTQPAISHHIRELEAELGGALVERSSRGVRPTPAGDVLVEHARVALAQLARATDRTRAVLTAEANQVRLAAFPSAAATFVADALGRLIADHPELQITFVEREPPEAVTDLRHGNVDVAVVFEYDEAPVATDDAVQRTLLGEDHLVAVLPRVHPHAHHERITLAALADDRWIAGCERCRTHLVHACRTEGFEPTVALATDDYLAVQRLVASGAGVSLLPALALHATHDPAVATRPLVTPHPRAVLALTPAAPPDAATSVVLAALSTAAAGVLQPCPRTAP